MKKQSGITLIALVITIIVMLILAGVSLDVLVGDNGVLTQSQEAKTTHEEAEEKELIDLAITAAQVKTYPEVDFQELKKNLQASFGDNVEIWQEENTTTGHVDYKIKLPNGKEYSTATNVKILDIFIESNNPVGLNGITVEGYMLEILDQTIGLRYLFTMPDEILNTGAKIKFSQMDEVIQEIEVDKLNKMSINKTEYYYATAECMSHLMVEDITFCIYNASDEAISNEYSYSIKAYGDAVIEKSEEHSNVQGNITEKEKQKVEYIKALLYFGGMIQKIHPYYINNYLASEGIEIDTSWITKEFLETYKKQLIGNSDIDLLKSARINVGSTISMIITMKDDINDSNKDEYRVKANEQLYELEKYETKDGYLYRARIPVKLTELNNMFDISVVDVSGKTQYGNAIKYGIYSYANSLLYGSNSASNNEEDKEAMRSIINLSECAKKVF